MVDKPEHQKVFGSLGHKVLCKFGSVDYIKSKGVAKGTGKSTKKGGMFLIAK
jgi:hypothetical protein